MLTAMSGMAPRVARCAGNSVAVRREVDAIVYETRVNLANTFNKFAEEAAGKPPVELPPFWRATFRAAVAYSRHGRGCAGMTDAEVRQQVERTDAFIVAFRELIASTADPARLIEAPCHSPGLVDRRWARSLRWRLAALGQARRPTSLGGCTTELLCSLERFPSV